VFDLPGKDSTEMLIGEKEWVTVEADGDGLDGWGSGGKGTGVLAVIGVLVCYVSGISVRPS